MRSPTTPPDTTSLVFTPTPDDMEDQYDGILVSSLGDSGAAIALTGAKEKALEALDGYYRTVCGQPNLLDDTHRPLTDAYFFLDTGCAVFTRTIDGGWQATPAAEDAPGAVPVTWFRHPSGPVPEPYARQDGPKLY